MKNLKHFILVILSIFFLSCNNNVKKEYWSNGNLKSEKTYVNDTLNGISSYYFEDGRKQYEYFYEKGVINKYIKKWYPNGKQMYVTDYKQNKRNGLHQEWDDKGTLRAKFYYINDTLHGRYIEWHENKQIKMEGYYLMGFQDSIWNTYDTRGLQVGVAQFDKGTGYTKVLYEDGRTKRLTNFYNNSKNGLEIYYEHSGKIVKEIMFERNKILWQKNY